MKVLRMLEIMLIDECVVERVKARSAVRGSAAANVDTDGVSACGCSSELEVFPQPSCSSDTKTGHGLVARIGSQIIQEYSKDNWRASVWTLARRAKKLNRLVAKVKAWQIWSVTMNQIQIVYMLLKIFPKIVFDR